jgi:hypothetical protein
VEGGESDEGVAEAAETVDQDTANVLIHGSQCSRDILVSVDDERGTSRKAAGRRNTTMA